MVNVTSRIGIGLLLEDEAFNKVRKLQIKLADDLKNPNGLKQPPHITIRRPFTPRNDFNFTDLTKLIDDVCTKYEPLDVLFDKYGGFNNTVSYLGLLDIDELSILHKDLTQELKTQGIYTESDPRDISPVFHTTLSYGLEHKQFIQAQSILKNIKGSLPIKSRIAHLGVFAQLNDQWIVLYVKKLGKD